MDSNWVPTCELSWSSHASPVGLPNIWNPASSAANGLGLGEPGQLMAIEFEDTGATTIAGPEYRLQLIVTGKYSRGQVRNLTRGVSITAEPQGIVEIDKSGLVKPLADGKVTIIAKASDQKSATIGLTVNAFANETPISFANEVVPVFTKFGCNAGNCHGKSGGQNGFALSLLGFYPKDDYGWLTRQTLGRRISIAQPSRSLLLLKATASIPHGGGQRLENGSPEYRLIRHWIAQGAPLGDAGVRKVSHIDVFPKPRQLPLGGTQQVAVIATYTDGSREDVTRLARYESNNSDICQASNTGLMTIGQSTGNVAVMIRYQGQAAVFSSTVPLGLPVDNLPKPKSFIDVLANKKFKEMGLPPSSVCDDATFLRRVTIDIAGRLPRLEEVEDFLADKSITKRDKLVDRLLATTDYADYFAKKWSALLRNKPAPGDKDPTPYLIFHTWIRDSLHRNKPYDRFVRDIVAASGNPTEHPPVVWYRRANPSLLQNPTESTAWMEDSAQVFLGTRLQCAKCHHHPFERWSQNDYYSYLAFWSRVRKKKILADRRPNDNAVNRTRIYHDRGSAAARNPRNNQTVRPAGLGQEPIEIPPDVDPRHALVDWMASANNPFFARALVNRYWKHFFGRGLVDPEDDIRATNPASNPELLNALAKHFLNSGFDMKQLIRTIATSNLYQLSAAPTEHNSDDTQNFSHFYTRRLNAEVLLDAIDQFTETQSDFSGLGDVPAETQSDFSGLGDVPAETRAVQLPHGGLSNAFLTVFGMPRGKSACECERGTEVTLTQSLHLVNSTFVQDKTNAERGRVARLAADEERSLEEKIKEIYLVAYSRQPDADELNVVTSYINGKEDKRKAFRDIVWTLINTKEFVFQH
ncbi:MAG: DUF1553 domain-containing protein [Planctomycetes bacterium]|nr:DUF1553 domain-containing protein [Planctomycetota bacterium]